MITPDPDISYGGADWPRDDSTSSVDFYPGWDGPSAPLLAVEDLDDSYWERRAVDTFDRETESLREILEVCSR